MALHGKLEIDAINILGRIVASMMMLKWTVRTMQGSHDKQTFMLETYWNKKIIKATVTVSSNGTVDTEGCKYHGKIQDSNIIYSVNIQ